MKSQDHSETADPRPLVMDEVRNLLQLKREMREHGGGEFADEIALASIDARETHLLEELTRLEAGGQSQNEEHARAGGGLNAVAVAVSAVIFLGAILASRWWGDRGDFPRVVMLLAVAYVGGLCVQLLPRYLARRTRAKGGL